MRKTRKLSEKQIGTHCSSITPACGYDRLLAKMAHEQIAEAPRQAQEWKLK